MPRAGPSRLPYTPCGNPQLLRNPVIGCLEPVITPCGTITEVPLNLANLILPGTSIGNQILPGLAPLGNIGYPATAPLTNQILPATLPLANPFLPVASPVSPYMPPISPFLPPASPCNNRCQYLKKIPIPPPCI